MRLSLPKKTDAASGGTVIGSAGGGVRAVDRPPDKLPPGVRMRAATSMMKQPPPLRSGMLSDDDDDDETTSTSDDDVSPIPPPRRHSVNADAGDDGVDESLWDIAHPGKTRLKTMGGGGRDTSMSSADSSGRHAARSKFGDQFKSTVRSQPTPRVSKLPAPPHLRRPDPPRAQQPPQMRPQVAATTGGGGGASDSDYEYEYEYETDDSESVVASRGGGGGTRHGSGGSAGRNIVSVNSPMQEETEKAIRKAQLLARIQQLAEKKIAVSKTLTFRTSEEELMVEVARMEVLHERSIRIQQGRAALMTTVNTTETVLGLLDSKPWLPVKFKMNGFTKSVNKSISDYDDALERGVEETLGRPGSSVWWVELLWILIPAMITYSFTNRFAEDPAYSAEVLKKNPEFQQQLAKEMARELTHTERAEREKVEAELRATQAQMSQLAGERTFAPAVSPLPSMNTPRSQKPSLSAVPPPRISRMQPPPPMTHKAVPSHNPLGDYPVNPAETQKMVQFLARQKEQEKQKQSSSSQNGGLPPRPSQRLATLELSASSDEE